VLTRVDSNYMLSKLRSRVWMRPKSTLDKATGEWVTKLVRYKLPAEVKSDYQAIAERLFPLDGVVSAPILSEEMELTQIHSGYVHGRRLYLELSPVFREQYKQLLVPKPTLSDAVRAMRMFIQTFHEFPLCEQMFCLIAAIFTAIFAPLMKNRPMILLQANMRGTGKSTLADCISIIFSGLYQGNIIAWPSSKAEFDKVLDGELLRGSPLMIFDNAVGSIGTPKLDSVLTSHGNSVSIRPLGSTDIKPVPTHAIVIVTSNNASFAGDTNRRSLSVYLNTELENPEYRDGFTIPNIRDYVFKHTPEMWRAAITVVRAYLLAPQMSGLTNTFSRESRRTRNVFSCVSVCSCPAFR